MRNGVLGLDHLFGDLATQTCKLDPRAGFAEFERGGGRHGVSSFPRGRGWGCCYLKIFKQNATARPAATDVSQIQPHLASEMADRWRCFDWFCADRAIGLT